jgi:hypothetical protein
MTIIISINRLKIYRNYGGDIDGILKMKKKADLEVFGPDIDTIWTTITSFTQNVELIEKGLVSKGYRDQIMNEMKALCDSAAFYELTKNISN